MGHLALRYDEMKVTARSPDRSVAITVTGRGGITVELANDVTRTHSEADLGRQAAAAVRVAIAAYQQEQARAIEETLAMIGDDW